MGPTYKKCLYIACFLCSVAIAIAQQTQNIANVTTIPRLIRFAGSLHFPASQPAGITGATFAIYSQQEGGTPLWSEDQNVALDSNGNYAVVLGSTTNEGVPAELFTAGEARWLQVKFYLPDEVDLPRVLLVSVPYALKAGDADTLGGRPASAFLLAGTPTASRAASTGAYPGASLGVRPEAVATDLPGQVCGSLSSDGTAVASQIGKFTSTCNLEPSAIFETGGKVGIGTASPAASLDVKGTANIRGTLNLPPQGAATAAAGANSQPLDLVASSFSSTAAQPFNQYFRWQVEAAGNNTSKPSGTLNLLYTAGPGRPAETGLAINSAGLLTFAAGQTFPGAGGGTITGVTAGTDLTGGGTSQMVSLNLDTTKVPQLGTPNTFTGNQTLNGQLISTLTTGIAPLVINSTTQVKNLNASQLGGLLPTSFAPTVIACAGAPGNTIGAYRQQCQTTTGAVYACNNLAGCTVAANWAGAGTQWISSGTSIYYNSGNVGIGTTSPTAPLFVTNPANTYAAMVKFQKGVGSDSSLDLYESDYSGNLLRLYRASDTYAFPTVYFNNGAGLFMGSWMTISGHRTGTNITPPSSDPAMIDCWADVGDCIQARPNTSSDFMYSGINAAGTEHVMAVDNNGAYLIGAGARSGFDTALWRNSAGVIGVSTATGTWGTATPTYNSSGEIDARLPGSLGATQPTCTSGIEGMPWYTPGAGSVNGKFQICQNQSGIYSWITH